MGLLLHDLASRRPIVVDFYPEGRHYCVVGFILQQLPHNVGTLYDRRFQPANEDIYTYVCVPFGVEDWGGEVVIFICQFIGSFFFWPKFFSFTQISFIEMVSAAANGGANMELFVF